MVKYLQLESSMGSHCVWLTKTNVSHKIKTIIGWLMPKSANKILLTTHWPPFFFQVRVGKCDLRFARQSRHVQIQHVTYCHLRLLKSYFPCTQLCVIYSSFVNFGPLKTWITGNLKVKVFLYLCYGIACHGSMGRLTFQMYDVGYHTLPAQFHFTLIMNPETYRAPLEVETPVLEDNFSQFGVLTMFLESTVKIHLMYNKWLTVFMNLNHSVTLEPSRCLDYCTRITPIRTEMFQRWRKLSNFLLISVKEQNIS